MEVTKHIRRGLDIHAWAVVAYVVLCVVRYHLQVVLVDIFGRVELVLPPAVLLRLLVLHKVVAQEVQHVVGALLRLLFGERRRRRRRTRTPGDVGGPEPVMADGGHGALAERNFLVNLDIACIF